MPAADSLTVNNNGQIVVGEGHTFTAAAMRNDIAPSAVSLASLVGVLVGAKPGAATTANLGLLSNYDPVTNTLTGGVYTVRGAPYPDFNPPGYATLIFKGARIVTNAAGLQLTGGGKITDEFGNDALEPLAINNGVLILEQTFETAGDFTNNGTLILFPPADQDQFFVVNGKLTNFDAASKTLNGGTYVVNAATNYSQKLASSFQELTSLPIPPISVLVLAAISNP